MHLQQFFQQFSICCLFCPVLLEMHTNNNGLICTDFSQACLIGKERCFICCLHVTHMYSKIRSLHVAPPLYRSSGQPACIAWRSDPGLHQWGGQGQWLEISLEYMFLIVEGKTNRAPWGKWHRHRENMQTQHRKALLDLGSCRWQSTVLTTAAACQYGWAIWPKCHIPICIISFCDNDNCHNMAHFLWSHRKNRNLLSHLKRKADK